MNKNHFSLYRLCLVCFSILLLASPLLAEANSLEIKCQDPSGNPIVGANVQIQPLGAKPKDKKSDSKGMALFNKLDDGAYRILARKEGFAPALYEFAFMKGGSSQSITLKFEQGDAQKKVYFEDPALGQKAMELLNQGSEQLRSGKFADAEKTILASLEIYPSNAEAQFNLSIAYLQNRKWGEAEEMLKKTSQLLGMLSSLPPPKDGRALPYGELRQRTDAILAQLPLFKLRSDADKALSERKFDVAAEKYAEALKTQASDPDLYYNLALAQAQGRHFDDAMQSIDKAIQLKPGENAYADLKKRIADFKENEILNKAQGLVNEGDKLLKAADYAGARSKYEEALKMIPEGMKAKQAVVLDQVAKTQDGLKQGENAVATWKKAIESVRDDPAYKDALAKLSEFKKSHPVLAPGEAEKVTAMEQEVAKFASQADTYRNELAQYYLREKKYDEALNIYADPNAAGNQPVDQVLFKLGQTQSNQGNSEVAQLAYERAIKANPQNAEAYYELGMLLYQSKKADKQATEIITKYLALGQDPAHKDNAQSVLVVLKKRMK